MKLNAPTKIVWLIAVILGVIGIIGHFDFNVIHFITDYAFWLVTAAFALLALSTYLKGL